MSDRQPTWLQSERSLQCSPVGLVLDLRWSANRSGSAGLAVLEAVLEAAVAGGPFGSPGLQDSAVLSRPGEAAAQGLSAAVPGLQPALLSTELEQSSVSLQGP